MPSQPKKVIFPSTDIRYRDTEEECSGVQKVEVKYEKQKVVVKYENDSPRAEQALVKGEKEKETPNRKLKSLVDGGASIRKDLVQ